MTEPNVPIPTMREVAMNRRKLTLPLIILLSGTALAGKVSKQEPALPADFKSDGCSLFPDGNYRDCCVEHDKAYYVGGSWQQRLRADSKLFACVTRHAGIQNKLVAPFMWIGVRVGGPRYIPTPYRWGYGNDIQDKNQKK